jgi:hypothetical protein
MAALEAGLICSAETAPQISNSARPKASLCIDLGPVSLFRPKPITNHGGNWSAKLLALEWPYFVSNLWATGPFRRCSGTGAMVARKA